MYLEIVLGFILLSLVFWKYMTWNWDFWTKQGVYQIEPRFPVGSMPELITKSKAVTDMTLAHSKETKNLPFYGVYFFRNPILMIKDVNLVRQVLVKDFDSFVDRDKSFNHKIAKTHQLADKIWSEQMIVASGDNWKALRSTFSPIFTSGKMKAMLIFMQETCNRLTNSMMESAKEGEPFELRDILGKYSMDTIASCAFGVNAQAFSNKDSKFVKYAANIFRQTVTDGIKLAALFLPLDLGVNFMRLIQVAVTKQTETEFFYKVVIESLKQRRESKTRRNDLIDMMLDAIKGDIEEDANEIEDQFEKDAKLNVTPKHQKEFDELVIVSTAIVILVAGYDTTGTTLSWACYELAKNPDVQEKLRVEIEEVVGDSTSDLTYDDLQSMRYLDQVISETLRFHTPISILRRAVEKDYKIPGHDLIVKKNSDVWVNIMDLHFNPQHYSEPEMFNPDHFSKEAKAQRNPYAFLPFGQGPRGCLGMRFALFETKLALANIVRKFNLIPSDKTKEPLELDPTSGITYAKNGLYVMVEQRN